MTQTATIQNKRKSCVYFMGYTVDIGMILTARQIQSFIDRSFYYGIEWEQMNSCYLLWNICRTLKAKSGIKRNLHVSLFVHHMMIICSKQLTLSWISKIIFTETLMNVLCNMINGWGAGRSLIRRLGNLANDRQLSSLSWPIIYIIVSFQVR